MFSEPQAQETCKLKPYYSQIAHYLWEREKLSGSQRKKKYYVQRNNDEDDASFSLEMMQERRQWDDTFEVVNGKAVNFKVYIWQKISFKTRQKRHIHVYRSWKNSLTADKPVFQEALQLEDNTRLKAISAQRDEGHQKWSWHSYQLRMRVYGSSICNSLKLEITQMSFSKWSD